MVTIVVENSFSDFNVYMYNLVGHLSVIRLDLCELRITELTILLYDNKAFMYIWSFEVKITVFDLKLFGLSLIIVYLCLK